MTKAVLAALDTITAKVMAYRPKGKGEAAKKVATRIKRKAKREEKKDARE